MKQDWRKKTIRGIRGIDVDDGKVVGLSLISADKDISWHKKCTRTTSRRFLPPFPNSEYIILLSCEPVAMHRPLSLRISKVGTKTRHRFWNPSLDGFLNRVVTPHASLFVI